LSEGDEPRIDPYFKIVAEVGGRFRRP